MNAFEAWNLRLLQEFFSAGADGKEVFIGTSPDVLDKMGADLGGDAGFLEAVRNGPTWRFTRSGFVCKLNELKERRTSSRQHVLGYTDPSKYDSSFRHAPLSMAKSAPAYLPYLALFARVAAVAKRDGFYARLRQDLGLPANWGSIQMKQVEGVWDDLQAWTKSTSWWYGRFVVRSLGKFPYIGLAKAQVIIAARDIPALQEMFKEHGLLPGEEITKEKLGVLLDTIRDSYGLSTGLRQAANDNDYREELEDLLISIHDDWDGVAYTSSITTKQESTLASEARFGLALGENNALPWCLQLAIQDDDGQVVLGDQVAPWKCSNRLGLGLVGRLEPRDSLAFLNGRDWRTSIAGHEVRIRRRSLWVLTANGSSGLWEDALPVYGAAFLLATEDGRDSLAEYLCREKPSYQEVSQLDGLPDGWRMVYLDKCQDLSDGQRNLPDGQSQKQWVIGLEGGVSIMHDSERTYFHYDLPRAVLNASPEVSIRCNGIDLGPLDGGIDGTLLLNGLPLSVSARRFELPQEVEAGGEFTLEAVDKNGRAVGSRKLKVLDRRRTQFRAEVRGNLGLDNLGRIAADGAPLRGGLPAPLVRDNGGEPSEASLRVFSKDLGSPLDPQLIGANPSARFLDALSQVGSMTYGRAKSLLDRLLPLDGSQAKFWHLIMDLWARGHVEIERTEDGRIERIHAIPPCAYLLPATAGDSRLLGVLGTMTLGQWASVAQCDHGWAAVADRARASWSCLPVVRLCTRSNNGAISALLKSNGVGLLPMQGIALARWSASEAQAKNGITRSAEDDPPHSNPRKLKKFDPRQSKFLSCSEGLRKPTAGEPELVLYEYDALYVEGWKNYVIAGKGGFSLVMDLQWAKWIARGVSGLGLRNLIASYDESSRQLWLPSSLRLPIVLDRALVLCNGGPPGEYMMEGREEDGRTWLQPAGTAYDLKVDVDLYASLANGRWLRYDWVPPSVIQAIRGKGK